MQCYKIKLETTNSLNNQARIINQITNKESYLNVINGYFFAIAEDIAQVAVHFPDALEILWTGIGVNLEK